jgi:hypothetical protein
MARSEQSAVATKKRRANGNATFIETDCGLVVGSLQHLAGEIEIEW